MAIEHKIIMDRKNTKKVIVKCNLNLSDYIAYLSVKEDISSTSYVTQVTGDINTFSGTITFEIPYITFVNDGIYFYDITIVSPSERYTLVKGQIDVKWVVMD